MTQVTLFAVGMKLGAVVDMIAMFPEVEKAEGYCQLMKCCDEHFAVYEVLADIVAINQDKRKAKPAPTGEDTTESRQLARFPYYNEASRTNAQDQAKTACAAFISGGVRAQWRAVEDATGTAYVVERLG